jgi:hypothetical protein
MLTRIAKGVLAGVVGTLAMDLVWYGRYRRSGGDDGFADWEFATSTASFDEASAPGKVGKKLADAVGVELPEDAAGTTTNVMHWLTGIGYGVGHAVLQDGRASSAGGLATGAGAFANSYATLGAMGIYEPMWRYDRRTLAKDLSAHLVFGLATGLAYRALSGSHDDAAPDA